MLLKQHCVKCHGGDKIRGDLDLTTRAGLLKGGEEGPSVIPGKAGESFLMTVLRHEEEPFMPAKADKLSPDALKKIADWINLGAPYDQPLVKQSIAGKGMQVTDDDRNFWAYAPLKAVKAPVVQQNNWPANDIDRFVLRKLESASCSPTGWRIRTYADSSVVF